MVLSDVQSDNISVPRRVIPLFSVMFSRAVHPANARVEQLLTDAGIVIDVKDVQFWNTALPIEVTVFGIVTSVSAEHSENRRVSMMVTPDGITALFRALHPLNA